MRHRRRKVATLTAKRTSCKIPPTLKVTFGPAVARRPGDYPHG